MADKEVIHHEGGGSGMVIGIVIVVLVVLGFLFFGGYLGNRDNGGNVDVNVPTPAPTTN